MPHLKIKSHLVGQLLNWILLFRRVYYFYTNICYHVRNSNINTQTQGPATEHCTYSQFCGLVVTVHTASFVA